MKKIKYQRKNCPILLFVLEKTVKIQFINYLNFGGGYFYRKKYVLFIKVASNAEITKSGV